MDQGEEFIQTSVLSVVFLGLLLVLGIFQQQFTADAFTDPTLVGIALTPIILFLVVTGRLRKFSGGGFEIVLQEQARKFVSPGASEKVDADPARLDAKVRESELAKIKARAPTGLTFELGRGGFYESGAIEEYLRSIETLEFVVFTDSEDQFEGYAPVQSFRQLLENADVDVVEAIESGEIVDSEIVRTNAIGSHDTNRECLREMSDKDVSELAVVNSNDQFVNIITQDAIVRTIMSSALSEV